RTRAGNEGALRGLEAGCRLRTVRGVPERLRSRQAGPARIVEGPGRARPTPNCRRGARLCRRGCGSALASVRTIPTALPAERGGRPIAGLVFRNRSVLGARVSEFFNTIGQEGPFLQPVYFQMSRMFRARGLERQIDDATADLLACLLQCGSTFLPNISSASISSWGSVT